MNREQAISRNSWTPLDTRDTHRLLLTSRGRSMFPAQGDSTLYLPLTPLCLLLFLRTAIIRLGGMGLTEEEADFLDSLPALASTNPPPLPLKHKKPHARQRSNSLGLNTNLYKYPSSLTGPPSPSELNAAGSISGPGTNLASSLWPRKGGSSYSVPPSTLSSSTSPEPEPNSEVNAEAKLVYLPPISPSRRSGPSESLPPLIPRLSRPSTPSTPHSPSTPSTPSTPSKTSHGAKPFLLRSPSVDWRERGPVSPGAPLNQSRKKGRGTFWTAIQEAGVPIYLGTPGFDGESRSLRIHVNVSNNYLRSVRAMPFRTRNVLFAYCAFDCILGHRSVLSCLRRGAEVIKGGFVGIFAHSGKQLELMNYFAGFRPRATLTQGSYNTQPMLWYVVNQITKPRTLQLIS